MGVLLSFKQAFAQIARNKIMTAASLVSITAILLVLGIFFVIIVNINSMAEGIKQDFDQVQVYLLDSVTVDQATQLQSRIETLAGVSGTSYLPREDALQQWKEKWGENADLLDRMQTNPLPNSVIINISDLGQATAIVNQVKGMDGIEKVSYSQDTVDKLLQITRVVQIISLIIILVLVFISILVVSNTIKLTVLAREKEISIMRYVGATNWFIRGPFLLEGVVLGLIAAAIASVVIGVLYHYFIARYGTSFLLLMSNSFVNERFLNTNLAIIFAAIGASVGACGSIISVRRFLEK